MKLGPVNLSQWSETESTYALSGKSLAEALTPHNNSCAISVARGGNGTATVTGTKRNKRADVVINLSSTPSCFPIDFLAVDLKPTGQPTESPVDLEFTNDVIDELAPDDLIRSFITLPSTGSVQTVIFSMRSHPTWALGGRAHQVMLRLPRGCAYELSSIRSLPASKLIPSISFPHSDCLGSKGFAHFARTSDSIVVSYDASQIEGAGGVELEVTKKNTNFEWPNSPDEAARVLARSATTAGAFTVSRKDFPDSGLYELRCHATGAAGKRIAFSSDHFVASVDQ
jgi:hypothetical protein